MGLLVIAQGSQSWGRAVRPVVIRSRLKGEPDRIWVVSRVQGLIEAGGVGGASVGDGGKAAKSIARRSPA